MVTTASISRAVSEVMARAGGGHVYQKWTVRFYTDFTVSKQTMQR